MDNVKQKNMFIKEVGTHLINGIKFVIPLIVLYSIFLFLGGRGWVISDFFDKIATYIYLLIVPLLSAFIAKSIVDMKGFIPALLVGYLADYLGTGFIGGMVTGLLVGYCMKIFLAYMSKLTMGDLFKNISKYFIIPVLTIIVTGLIINYLFAPPVVFVLDILFEYLVSLSGGNLIILAIVIGAMTSFDLGGPVNKVAFAFVLTAYLDGLYEITGPALIAVTIPPLALGIATIIIPNKFGKDEIKYGKTALLMSIVGLTEGALPFAIKNPLVVVPSVVVGSALASGLASYLNLSNTIMAPSVIGIFGTSNWLLYIFVHLIGVIVTILLIILLKAIKKEDKLLES